MNKIVSGKKRIKRMLTLSAATGRNWRSKDTLRDGGTGEGLGKPSVYHATVVIFLEFFAWGLLTGPTMTVLGETFGEHTFLMNGMIQGIKGILSFLSAPLIGALSDVWGRKSFLLLTVFFTCMPIPLLRFNPWWFFACVSVSGVFACTFSVVFAYVADCTEENDRSQAYGLVSATFAASLISSPALGAYLEKEYNATLVVVLATAVAVLDLIFILFTVPESLPERMRPASWGAPISWEQADPFASLRKVTQDSTVLLLCITVFLSYLPEAGQYSCIFLYLRQTIHFSQEDVGMYIAVIGLLSVIVQTIVLSFLIKTLGLKNSILLALTFQAIQLLWYGFGTSPWVMWAAGTLAAMSSLTYPSISAMISYNAEPDQQGVVQGIITGIRGLCNGIGPAMFGFIFYVFHVDLSDKPTLAPFVAGIVAKINNTSNHQVDVPKSITSLVAGPPFVFGAGMVFLSLLLAFFIPESLSSLGKTGTSFNRQRSERSRTLSASDFEDSSSELQHAVSAPTSDHFPLLKEEYTFRPE